MAARVVVVGAGLAGLTAGWALARRGVRVTVLEREERAGGRVLERTAGGMAVQAGASFLTNFYPRTLGLAGELGLAPGEEPEQPNGAVLRGGRRHPVSPVSALVSGDLLPPRSKLRLARIAWPILRHWRTLDPQRMWRADGLDTRSVTSYARARLDPELLEYLLATSLRSFLYWEPEQTSQAMLFIMLKQAPKLRYVALPGGSVPALPRRLAESLPVRLGWDVREVGPRAEGGYTVRAMAGDAERLLAADGVVCAAPATAVPAMVPELTPVQREFFDPVRYSSTLCAIVPSRGAPVSPYSGLLVPRGEARHLAAVTRRVDGERHALVLFASTEGARRLAGASDARAVDTLLAELRAADPGFRAGLDRENAVVQRWPEALPVFDVGHLTRLRHFHEGRYETGRLVFAGDYIGGPFVEGAVASGLDAAARLAARLPTTPGVD